MKCVNDVSKGIWVGFALCVILLAIVIVLMVAGPEQRQIKELKIENAALKADVAALTEQLDALETTGGAAISENHPDIIDGYGTIVVPGDELDDLTEKKQALNEKLEKLKEAIDKYESA